jgi:glycosyltransferase involved in cell wall biosynthesis
MRVAFLIPTIDRIGGAEQQVLLLAKELARRGHQVAVITLSGSGGDAAESLRSSGVSLLSLQMRKGLVDPSGWWRFHHWIRSHRPDVVHAHLPHAVLFARWSRLITPLRVLIETVHSPATGGLLRRIGYRASVNQSDAVTAVSRAAAQPWLSANMVDAAKLTILANGVDLAHFQSDHTIRRIARREFRLGDEFVWLAVGRLDPVKDHATLLRAVAKLAVKIRLLIAGSGPLERDLRHLATDLGINHRVHFLGFQPDILRWMQLADAFVLCSRWEGLSMALLEASACELPAVFTSIPAIEELLPACLADAGVPCGDADALAAAMTAVIQLSEQERRDLGLLMRQSIAEKFSLSDVVDEWEALYRTQLERKPQPTRTGKSVCVVGGNTLQVQ